MKPKKPKKLKDLMPEIIEKLNKKDKDDIHLTKSLEYIKNNLIEIEKVLDQLGGNTVKKGIEGLIDKVSENGLAGSSMNFYPSNNVVPCYSFCLGIATKKFGYHREKLGDEVPPEGLRTGFKGLMLDIIGYWITCDENKTTVLITLDWDDEAFEKDWEQIIKRHSQNGKTVMIYEILERNATYILRYPI